MNKIRICVLLICLQCGILSAELSKGKAIEKVDCSGAPGFSYALHLPSAYAPQKTWPVLFIFDADSQGRWPDSYLSIADLFFLPNGNVRRVVVFSLLLDLLLSANERQIRFSTRRQML
jgi:hypothetical protein